MGTVMLPQDIVREIESMPMLSEVASKLLQLTSDEDHDLKQVSRIVESDVYLSANVLKLANSVSFSRGHQIDSVQRAVLHIGEELVFSLAVELSTGSLLKHHLSGYHQEEGSLWIFCLQEAIGSRAVARFSKTNLKPDIAYTAGMMLNIGMVLMSSRLEKDLHLVRQKLDDPNHGDFIQAEREIIGTDRDQIGAQIAERWRLPESIVAAIQYGHRPAEAPEAYAPLVYAVHIGDILVRSIGYGGEMDALTYELDAGYKQYFNLEPANLEQVMLQIVDEFTKIRDYYLSQDERGS